MKKKALAFAAMACSVAMLLSACGAGGGEEKQSAAALLQELRKSLTAAARKPLSVSAPKWQANRKNRSAKS
mgnify:CR=1 FL=1